MHKGGAYLLELSISVIKLETTLIFVMEDLIVRNNNAFD